VKLIGVSPYSVVPTASFSDVPMTLAQSGPHAADASSCLGLSLSAVYRRVKNIKFSGGWNTVRVLGQDIPVGARVTTDFDLGVGVDDLAGAQLSLSCKLDVSASGMAGPIPVTGGIGGGISTARRSQLLKSGTVSVRWCIAGAEQWSRSTTIPAAPDRRVRQRGGGGHRAAAVWGGAPPLVGP
jgi:hypothetical protein